MSKKTDKKSRDETRGIGVKMRAFLEWVRNKNYFLWGSEEGIEYWVRLIMPFFRLGGIDARIRSMLVIK